MFKIAAMMLLFTLFGEGFANVAGPESCYRTGMSIPEKKLVVITGATKDIGLGLVGKFINCGWRVAGCGRSVEAVLELQNKYGKDAVRNIGTLKFFRSKVLNIFLAFHAELTKTIGWLKNLRTSAT